MELHTGNAALLEQYTATRQFTEHICRFLETEDFVAQPCPEVSPPKWHLAHTTWFFEELIMAKHCPNYQRFHPQFSLLFNSYYKTAGQHWPQHLRGQLSRPTVAEIFTYRGAVDAAVVEFFATDPSSEQCSQLLEIGIQHEMQHQELLLMDIKAILGCGPLAPTFLTREDNFSLPRQPLQWLEYSEDVYQIGSDGGRFAYDNECPRHKTYLYDFQIADRLVTNGEYREFMDDGGYQDSRLWLSMGWDWLQQHQLQAPLYWRKDSGDWHEFTLNGLRALEPQHPVCHINYYEASAFALWKGLRLPTEAELEVFLTNEKPLLRESFANSLHPINPASSEQLWCWTSSQYLAYPGYRCYKQELQEYNSKFMCNQFVLRGGCIVTPQGHYRPSYRNFYLPFQRWMFSGIRLAKDA